jgi:acetylornithine deacetylase/succinyl-diaminopimelate desuccinylase-like protein
LVLETDEEILDANVKGIRWLLANHRALIDAEFALNEGAGVGLKDGAQLGADRREGFRELRVRGHEQGRSQLAAGARQCIYRLAEGLTRLSKFTFPFKINETTRAFFARIAETEPQQTAADMRAILSGTVNPAALSLMRLSNNPVYNAQLRTTCVATMLEGGHAVNALPQVARARVNCRLMPGEPVEEVRETLVRVLADDQIKVTQTSAAVESVPSALHEEIMGAITKLSAEFWPGVPIVPTMSAGATDGSYLRNAGIPTYGHSGLASEIGDNRAHGRDEHVLVKSFWQGQEYLYRLVKMLAGGQ